MQLIIIMCGICAIFKSGKTFISTTHIQAMTDFTAHRGPDDEGYLLLKKEDEEISIQTACGYSTPSSVKCETIINPPKLNINSIERSNWIGALGHRRLSVIDLSPAGHQPMATADQRYWIVYNGEIYNHEEIREECKNKGYSFQSESDTEVILAAYIHWGKECVHKFQGMWAFIIVDTTEKTVFASRDRFGIKPLYYWHSPDNFLAFSSEIKAFTAIPGWSAELNTNRAVDFLVSGLTDHTRETLFSGVYQIRGGEAALFSLDNIPSALLVYRWYTPPRRKNKEKPSDIISKTRQLIEKSVLSHLVSDVPIGACLSGGLDSTTIIAIGKNPGQHTRTQKINETYTIIHPGYPDNEEEAVKKTCNLLGLINHTTILSPDKLTEELSEIIWYLDEPFKSTSIIAQWSLFRGIHEHTMKVVLDGQGPDEFLGGYPPHLPFVLFDLLYEGKILTFFYELVYGIFRLSLPEIIIKTWIPALLPNLPEKIIYQLDLPGKNAISFINKKTRDTYRTQKKEKDSRDKIPRNIFWDLSLNSSLPMLLRYEDRNSMAHSVESRLPFLNHELGEYLLNIPSEWRIHKGYSKYIVRKSLGDNIPDHVRVNRKKIGFSTPESEWFMGEYEDWFTNELERTVQSCKGFIDPEIMQYWKKIRGNPDLYSEYLWRIVVFGRWVQVFQVHIPNL